MQLVRNPSRHSANLSTWLSRLPLLSTGLFLNALATVLTLQAGLGLSPWSVLHQGLSRQIQLTFGQTSILVGAALIVVSLLLGQRPGVGTVLNMILIGLYIDLILWSGLVPNSSVHEPLFGLLMLTGGVATMGVGSALYIKAGLGAGPRDSLMLALKMTSGLRAGWVRAGIEATALVVGYLLGCTIGIGTIIFMLGIGIAIDVAFRVFKVQPHRERLDMWQ